MPSMLVNDAPCDEGLANEVCPLSHMLTPRECFHRSKRFFFLSLGAQTLSRCRPGQYARSAWIDLTNSPGRVSARTRRAAHRSSKVGKAA